MPHSSAISFLSKRLYRQTVAECYLTLLFRYSLTYFFLWLLGKLSFWAIIFSYFTNLLSSYLAVKASFINKPLCKSHENLVTASSAASACIREFTQEARLLPQVIASLWMNLRKRCPFYPGPRVDAASPGLGKGWNNLLALSPKQAPYFPDHV